MSYENATILFRHGPDDFSVWNVDLPAPLLREAQHTTNTATGDLGFILDQLPIDEPGAGSTLCQMLFEDGSSFALFSMEVAPDFFDEHRDEGCSVRGGKAEVAAEVEELLHHQAQYWVQAM